MKWNVYIYDINARKIKVFNIFEHTSFRKNVVKTLNKYIDNLGCEEFCKEIKSHLMYYFWCKAEWEITVWPWPSDFGPGIKVDIYQQVMNNWEQFILYLITPKEGQYEIK